MAQIQTASILRSQTAPWQDLPHYTGITRLLCLFLQHGHDKGGAVVSFLPPSPTLYLSHGGRQTFVLDLLFFSSGDLLSVCNWDPCMTRSHRGNYGTLCTRFPPRIHCKGAVKKPRHSQDLDLDLGRFSRRFYPKRLTISKFVVRSVTIHRYR